LGGIDGVADQFADKNVMVTVKEFLDDGKDVLGLNPDISFLHGIIDLWPTAKNKENAIVAGLTHCQEWGYFAISGENP
jgi:hypothetical protein